jgi:ABC-type dipeptide/oligopeptide/nickel transport system permease component
MALFATFIVQSIFCFLPEKQSLSHARVEQAQWDTSQYYKWLTELVSGEIKLSSYSSDKWYLTDLLKRSVNTFLLCGASLIFAMFIGGGAALIKSSTEDELISGKRHPMSSILFSSLGPLVYIVSAIPSYLIAYLLFFTFKNENSFSFAFVSLTLGSGFALDISRLTFYTQKKHLASKYVENAIACGMKTRNILPLPGTVAWYAFRNCLITVLPVIAIRLPVLISSALVVELACELPGLGEALLKAVINNQFRMVLFIILIVVIFVQVCVSLSKILTFFLHPRQYSV